MDIATILSLIKLAQGIKFTPELLACLQACVLAHAAGEIVPTPTPTPIGTKPFPGKITFDNTSDQGEGEYHGTACVLLGTEWLNVATGMSINGEVLQVGVPYQGRPVFRSKLTGDKILRPMHFVIRTTIGDFTHTSDAASTPAPGPSGGNGEESVAPSSYGNPEGAGGRGNARFSKPGSAYGKNIKVYIDGDLKMTVNDGAKRQEGPNGLIWKPVSDSNKKLVVVGQFGVRYKLCTIKW